MKVIIPNRSDSAVTVDEALNTSTNNRVICFRHKTNGNLFMLMPRSARMFAFVQIDDPESGFTLHAYSNIGESIAVAMITQKVLLFENFTQFCQAIVDSKI